MTLKRSIFDLAEPEAQLDEGITRKEEAYRHILELVLRGDQERDACFNEQKLAESFGMSRAPVREALHMLCSEKILTNIPRLGYKIVPISFRETLDALDVRLILEMESVRLACQNRSPEALAKLDDLIAQEQRISSEEDSIHAWIMQGDFVHTTIAELSQNMVLAQAIVSLIDLLRRASIQLILLGKNKPLGIHYHRDILEAVRRGDCAGAQELMRKDILILKELISRG